MSLTLNEIVSKIASQGKNPDVSFLKDNPQAQAMLLLAILSSSNNPSNKSNHSTSKPKKAERKASITPKKVGRKPVTSDEEDSDNPKSKRKAQNRAAQRAFRERKENQVRILEDKVKELESLTDKKNEKLIMENQQLKDMIKKLQDENASLLGSTVSFDVPLSSISMNGDDERPQKIIKRQQSSDTATTTSPISTASLSSYGDSKSSRSNTPETMTTNPYQLTMTVDDILNNTKLPSSALLDHASSTSSELFGVDFNTSQLNNLLQQQEVFNFETDPSQFDFFYPLDTTITANTGTITDSSSSSSYTDKKDITQIWDQLSEHPHYDEFNIDVLCDEMHKKAVCTDEHYDHNEELKKVISEYYPTQS